MKTPKEICHDRCVNDNSIERDKINRTEYQNYCDYEKFYNLREFFEFALNANVCEYVIDTRRELDDIAKIILSKIS